MVQEASTLSINEGALFPICELCFGSIAVTTMADGQEWCARCADWYARWNSMSVEEWESGSGRRRAAWPTAG
ncbi:hypothetical protein [Blastococcus sp. Marseille-P5729]|uniref:hypothetical protein n=1 Tax=Blastococcus sp. Marseille-P5729 TaxID=2086582 RepID=UPI000D0E73FD|nr:hypothetical protein [Blastococcus sp. Marseille-P5729]